MGQLTLTDVTKRFGEVGALARMNLDVRDGEFHCLFGPSAAGKTTTLRIVAGLERPDSGAVSFEGVDMASAPVQGRGMSMIFQSFALYPHLTTHQNLAYPLKEARVARAEIDSRVAEVAEMLRVNHTLGRKPGTLSGGEQQRVAIGRALVGRPKLLLLDEPLTNLDAKLRHDMRAEFKRLHRELGMTMLYATPDQLEALTMGERITVIRDGAVVQTGTPEELYEAPVDEYVGRMIGSPEMNLVQGRVDTAGATMRVATGFAELPVAAPACSHGDEVLVGLRPYDLRPVTGDASGPVFDMTIHMLEPLGDITLVDLVAGDVPLRMVLPEASAAELAPGNSLKIEVAVHNAHVFFSTTGVRAT